MGMPAIFLFSICKMLRILSFQHEMLGELMKQLKDLTFVEYPQSSALGRVGTEDEFLLMMNW